MTTTTQLKYFDELVAGGVSPQQAKAQVYALDGAIIGLAATEEIKHLEEKMDIKFGVIEKWGGSLGVAILILLLKIAFWP